MPPRDVRGSFYLKLKSHSLAVAAGVCVCGDFRYKSLIFTTAGRFLQVFFSRSTFLPVCFGGGRWWAGITIRSKVTVADFLFVFFPIPCERVTPTAQSTKPEELHITTRPKKQHIILAGCVLCGCPCALHATQWRWKMGFSDECSRRLDVKSSSWFIFVYAGTLVLRAWCPSLGQQRRTAQLRFRVKLFWAL